MLVIVTNNHISLITFESVYVKSYFSNWLINSWGNKNKRILINVLKSRRKPATVHFQLSEVLALN